MRNISPQAAKTKYQTYLKTAGKEPLSMKDWLATNKLKIKTRAADRRRKCRARTGTSASSSRGSFHIGSNGSISASSGHAYVVALQVRAHNRRC